MLDAFHKGGWGMYPTLLASLALIIAAVRYARHTDVRRLQVVRVLSFLVFLVACLGFTMGVINSFSAAGDKPDELSTLVVVGVGESLYNIGLGLCLLVVATIIRVLGTSRMSESDGGELHDPHTH